MDIGTGSVANTTNLKILGHMAGTWGHIIFYIQMMYYALEN